VIDPAAGSESGRIGNLNPQARFAKNSECGKAFQHRASREDSNGKAQGDRREAKKIARKCEKVGR